jgi:hypothetical protein
VIPQIAGEVLLWPPYSRSLAPPLRAQAPGSATLGGTVFDPTGRVLPNASVVVRNESSSGRWKDSHERRRGGVALADWLPTAANVLTIPSPLE